MMDIQWLRTSTTIDVCPMSSGVIRWVVINVNLGKNKINKVIECSYLMAYNMNLNELNKITGKFKLH